MKTRTSIFRAAVDRENGARKTKRCKSVGKLLASHLYFNTGKRCACPTSAGTAFWGILFEASPGPNTLKFLDSRGYRQLSLPQGEDRGEGEVPKATQSQLRLDRVAVASGKAHEFFGGFSAAKCLGHSHNSFNCRVSAYWSSIKSLE